MMFSIDYTKPAALPSPNLTCAFWVNSSSDANPFVHEGTSGLLTTDTDMCIIGSGITGISMAYLKQLYHYFTLLLITLITTFYFFTYITLHLHPFHNSHTQAECISCLLLYPTPQNILLYSSEFYTSPKLLLRQYISSILSLVVLTFRIVFSLSNISLQIDSSVVPFKFWKYPWHWALCLLPSLSSPFLFSASISKLIGVLFSSSLHHSTPLSNCPDIKLGV